jgi:hypothetical protein
MPICDRMRIWLGPSMRFCVKELFNNRWDWSEKWDMWMMRRKRLEPRLRGCQLIHRLRSNDATTIITRLHAITRYVRQLLGLNARLQPPTITLYYCTFTEQSLCPSVGLSFLPWLVTPAMAVGLHFCFALDSAIIFLIHSCLAPHRTHHVSLVCRCEPCPKLAFYADKAC